MESDEISVTDSWPDALEPDMFLQYNSFFYCVIKATIEILTKAIFETASKALDAVCEC